MRHSGSTPHHQQRPAPFVLLLWGVVLAAGTWLAYARSFSAPLILDDWTTIQNNPAIRLMSLTTLLAPADPTGVGGRPIAHASFVLNYAVSGESLRGYHVVNLAIHFAAGLALWGVVRRTLRRPGLGEFFGREADWLSGAVAAFWLWHPIQTQSVTYVSQRTESLMGLFYFLTLYAFARSVEAGARVRRWQVAAVVSCLAGIGSKEGMVTAPLMILLYDYVFVTRSLAETWRRRWPLYLAFAASWFVLAILIQGVGGRGVGFQQGMTWWSYLLIECRAIVLYAWLAVWPAKLVFDYGPDLGPAGAIEVGCGLALLAFAVWLAASFRRAPRRAFLGAWFLITLAPTSSVVPIPLQPISENRVYVPLAAVVVALVFAAHARLGARARWALGAAATGLVALTFARHTVYQSEVAVWRDTVAKRPDSSRAHNNLGHALRGAGVLAEAKTALETAIRLKPDYADAHANLAAVMGQLGRVEDAVALSQRAVQLDPHNADAYYNLGVAWTQKGNVPEAIAAYETMIRLRPGAVQARSNLALLLLRADRTAEAIRHAEAALQLAPAFPDARFALGCGLALSNQPAAALPHFQETLRLQPAHLDARVNLAVTYERLGRTADAIAAFENALRLNPNHLSVRYQLGVLLVGAQRYADAAAHLQATVQAAPGEVNAHSQLGVALLHLGRQEEAVACFETALQLDPAASVARSQLQKIRGEAGATK